MAVEAKTKNAKIGAVTSDISKIIILKIILYKKDTEFQRHARSRVAIKR